MYFNSNSLIRKRSFLICQIFSKSEIVGNNNKKKKKYNSKNLSKIFLLLDEETCPKGRSRNRDIANELETTRTCETEEDWCVEGMSSIRGI